MASAIPKAKYRIIIGNATWTHTIPEDSGAYSLAALGVGNTAMQQEQLKDQHMVLVQNHAYNLKVKEAGKELIFCAAGDDALAPLKKQYIGFGDEILLGMINHLCTTIKMMTAQNTSNKDQQQGAFQTSVYNKPHNLT